MDTTKNYTTIVDWNLVYSISDQEFDMLQEFEMPYFLS